MRVAMAVLLLVSLFAGPAGAMEADVLKKELAYLHSIEGVKWVEFDRNWVYIGWAQVPPDIAMINNAAAMAGNRAINFGTHVWSVEASSAKPGWRPGDTPHICNTTARKGKIESSTCR